MPGMDSMVEDGLQASPYPAQPKERPSPSLPLCQGLSLQLPASITQPAFCALPLPPSLHFVQTLSPREEKQPKFPLQLHLIPGQSKGTFVGGASGPRSVSAETDVSVYPTEVLRHLLSSLFTFHPLHRNR